MQKKTKINYLTFKIFKNKKFFILHIYKMVKKVKNTKRSKYRTKKNKLKK